MKPFDTLVFIGRFQPLHQGHIHVINEAKKLAKTVLVLVGSANSAPSPKNPFTYEERRWWILDAVDQADAWVSVKPLPDSSYNDTAWIANVQQIVNGVTGGNKTGIIGFSKDHTSYYLKLFPEWGAVEIPTQFSVLNSSNIREGYFQRYFTVPTEDHCPPNVVRFLSRFTQDERFKWLVDEAEFYRGYHRIWEHSPFPVQFNCADAIVVQAGHILLIERKSAPGKGLLAVPGGHINNNETFEQCAIRELKEETRISDDKGELPPAMLASFIEGSKLFDAPGRSLRGRVISNAFFFRLPKREKLYIIKGNDDAKEAFWHPLGSLDPSRMFEDHYSMIQTMLGNFN
jgi:bifunctional NMN adenylyltransferase/nudix hydrolase